MIKAKGFSLIEFLVSISVLGVMVGFSVPVINQYREVAKQIDAKTKTNEFLSNVYLNTFYSDGCRNLLGGLRLQNGEINLPAGNELKNKIESMDKAKLTLEFKNVINTGLGGLRAFNLIAKFEMQESEVAFQTKQLAALVAEVDGSGRISNCYSPKTAQAKNSLVSVLCQTMGATYDPATKKCDTSRVNCDNIGGVWKSGPGGGGCEACVGNRTLEFAYCGTSCPSISTTSGGSGGGRTAQISFSHVYTNPSAVTHVGAMNCNGSEGAMIMCSYTVPCDLDHRF